MMTKKIKNFLENILCKQFKILVQTFYTDLRNTNRQLLEKIKHIENMEQELKAAKEKYENSFNHCNIGKSITFISGEMEVNQCFRDMLGYDADEFSNIKWQDITHPDDIQSTQKMIELMMSGEEKNQTLTKRYIHKNGGVIWVDICSCMQRDLNGKPIYFVSNINNVTHHMNPENQMADISA